MVASCWGSLDSQGRSRKLRTILDERPMAGLELWAVYGVASGGPAPDPGKKPQRKWPSMGRGWSHAAALTDDLAQLRHASGWAFAAAGRTMSSTA